MFERLDDLRQPELTSTTPHTQRQRLGSLIESLERDRPPQGGGDSSHAANLGAAHSLIALQQRAQFGGLQHTVTGQDGVDELGGHIQAQRAQLIRVRVRQLDDAARRGNGLAPIARAVILAATALAMDTENSDRHIRTFSSKRSEFDTLLSQASGYAGGASAGVGHNEPYVRRHLAAGVQGDTGVP